MSLATVADLVADAEHAGPPAGASGVGQAAAGGRIVRIALWRSEGRIVRARFGATTCASLIASAEAACRALEAGTPPERLDGAAIRSYIAGLHPRHRDRADLVAEAVRAAVDHAAESAVPQPPEGSQPP